MDQANKVSLPRQGIILGLELHAWTMNLTLLGFLSNGWLLEGMWKYTWVRLLVAMQWTSLETRSSKQSKLSCVNTFQVTGDKVAARLEPSVLVNVRSGFGEQTGFLDQLGSGRNRLRVWDRATRGRYKATGVWAVPSAVVWRRVCNHPWRHHKAHANSNSLLGQTKFLLLFL